MRSVIYMSITINKKQRKKVMDMDITLKNYATLIGKNWIEPSIQNSATEIEKVVEATKEYGWDYTRKEYYLSSLLNNNKYEISIYLPDRRYSCNKNEYAHVKFEAYSLNSFLMGGNKPIEDHVIVLKTEADCLTIQKKLESWLPKKTTTTTK